MSVFNLINRKSIAGGGREGGKNDELVMKIVISFVSICKAENKSEKK